MEDSVVDKVLARHGFSWMTGPYRIVDAATGAVVVAGPRFDLRAEALAARRERFNRIAQTRFKRGG